MTVGVKPVYLSLKKALPKIRKAFDAGNIQFQSEDFKANTNCKYTGPCAVGAAMTVKDRLKAERSFEGYGIRMLVDDGCVVIPDDEVQAFEKMQFLHDEGNVNAFGLYLAELEAKQAKKAARVVSNKAKVA